MKLLGGNMKIMNQNQMRFLNWNGTIKLAFDGLIALENLMKK